MDTLCNGCIFNILESDNKKFTCELGNIEKFRLGGADIETDENQNHYIKNRICNWQRNFDWLSKNFDTIGRNQYVPFKKTKELLQKIDSKIREEINPNFTVIIYDVGNMNNFIATVDSIIEQSLNLISRIVVVTNQNQTLYMDKLTETGKLFTIKKDATNRDLDSILNECVELNCAGAEFLITISSGFQLSENFIENVVSSMLDKLQINSIILADKMLSHYPWNGMVIKKDAWDLSRYNNIDAGNVAQKTISLCKRYDCCHTVKSHKELCIEIH